MKQKKILFHFQDAYLQAFAVENPRHLIALQNAEAGELDRGVHAAYDIVAGQSIVTAQGRVIRDRSVGRRNINELIVERREEIEQMRRNYLQLNPGEQLYRNDRANRIIEANTNQRVFFYPELILEYTPSRNGASETFYIDYNSVGARQMNEFLFVSRNGNRIHGDLASRFQRASNRHDERHVRNARPIIVQMNDGQNVVDRVVIVATRNIRRGEQIIL